MRASPSMIDKHCRTALAACVAAAFSISAPAAVVGNTWIVTTCADDGAGSLRAAVASAATGDTVDLSHLTAASPGCANALFPLYPATISLTTGSIAISQADLTLLGPGPDKLLITRAPTGAPYDHLFYHNHNHVPGGEFHVSAMSLSGGYVRYSGFGGAPRGGCIFSYGNLTIDHVNATMCKATDLNSGYAYGGAIYAKGNATVTNSVLTDNVASVRYYGTVHGGAIFARGKITVTGSMLAHNQANGDTSAFDTYASLVYGGAIAGNADVTITASVLTQNSAHTETFAGCDLFCTLKTYVGGGAVFAKGALTLTNTDLVDNSAILDGTLPLYGTAAGGAAVSAGNFVATNSVISGNTARAPVVTSGKYLNLGIKGMGARSGGVNAKASATISGSTISGNKGGGLAGGIFIYAPGAEIDNTTISGNSAYQVGGAIVELPATIRNSTISFNTATYIFEQRGPGLLVAGNAAATLVGTLISNNTAGSGAFAVDYDLSTYMTTPDFKSTSANNLVRVTSNAVKALLPADTITGSCPLLGPLRNNGGPTPTHALMSHSPAIDVGNTLGLPPNDQRGPPYLRQSGAKSDIGAYEVQQDEIVFTASFDGCT